jgi:trigger factor
MQSNLTHHTTTRKSLEVIVPAPEVNVEYGKIVAEVCSKVKISGFRPGKAPKEVVLSRYAREIRSEVAENLIKRYFASAAESCGVKPISRPTLDKMELNENADGIFNILFDVEPEVIIPEYKNINITKKKRLISDDDVIEQLEYLRQETAKLIPLNDGVAEVNHYVTIDVTVKPQGLKAATYKDQVIQLADGRPFDAEILNMKLNESKKFSITVPADDKNKVIASKTVSYEVTVKDLRIRELSEINDDFAKDLGQYTTLDELKTSIRADLENFAETDAVSRAHQNILEKLLSATSFEVPHSMVAIQLDDYCQEFAKLISKQGIDPKKINWEAYRKTRTSEAERIVRSSYLLQAIGNAEDIQATDEEVNENIKNFMRDNKVQQPFELFRKKIEDDGAIGEIRGRVRTYNTLNHILSFANVAEELLDKNAFAALIESEREHNSHISKPKCDLNNTNDDNSKCLANEHNDNATSTSTEDECHKSSGNHNHSESAS